MRISSRCEYGLRAMVYLAAHDDGAPLSLSRIAAAEDLPAHFLERVLARLRDAGLVRTVRGAAGGYALALPARRITADAVMTAVDGPLSLVGCLPAGSGCERAADCASQVVWRRLDDAMRDALGRITLADLVQGSDA